MYERSNHNSDVEIAVVPSREPFVFSDDTRIWVDADHPVTGDGDEHGDGDNSKEQDDDGHDEGPDEGANKWIEDERMTRHWGPSYNG
jgi:hypothetical protein